MSKPAALYALLAAAVVGCGYIVGINDYCSSGSGPNASSGGGGGSPGAGDGVHCGTNTCSPSDVCCIAHFDNSNDPVDAGCGGDRTDCASGSYVFVCDDDRDCQLQSLGAVCCAPEVNDYSLVSGAGSTCAASCDPGEFELCDPQIPGGCSDGGSCVTITGNHGFYRCR